MGISVIIPTYNGLNSIKRSLEALKLQTSNDFELIVVIDGSTDGTRNFIESFDLNALKLELFETKNQGRSAARNFGAGKAKFNYLLFLDDDMTLEREGVEQHLEFHNSNPESILVGDQREHPDWLETEAQRFKGYLSSKWLAKVDQGKQAGKPFLTAAHFSIEKKTFDRLQGFDENLNDAEDEDLAIRATKLGIPIFFDSNIRGWHFDPVTFSSLIQRQRQYGKAGKTLREQYNELNKTSPNKKILYKPFALRKVMEKLDKGWIPPLPKKLRFWYYERMLTAFKDYYPDIKL